jgi:hypothetical protein
MLLTTRGEALRHLQSLHGSGSSWTDLEQAATRLGLPHLVKQALLAEVAAGSLGAASSSSSSSSSSSEDVSSSAAPAPAPAPSGASPSHSPSATRATLRASDRQARGDALPPATPPPPAGAAHPGAVMWLQAGGARLQPPQALVRSPAGSPPPQAPAGAWPAARPPPPSARVQVVP